MKASKPGTDQEAEFSIFINGLESPLEEYELHSRHYRHNTVECYVPVTHGDEVAVKGWFAGTLLHGSFDLVCDGSLAANSHIEGKNGQSAHRRRAFEWRKVLHSVKPHDWKSTEQPKDAAEGKLSFRSLENLEMDTIFEHETYDDNEPMPGLGSIEVVVSINGDARDNYFNQEWGCHIGHWRQRRAQTVRNPGILPDHELTIEITEPVVSRKRALRFKRRWEGTRFGSKPWARFIFYYRNLDAITDAGAVPVISEKLLESSPHAALQHQEESYGTMGNNSLLRNVEEGDFVSTVDDTFFSQSSTSRKSSMAPDVKQISSLSGRQSTHPQQDLRNGDSVVPQTGHTGHLGETFKLPSNYQDSAKKSMKRLGGTLILKKSENLAVVTGHEGSKVENPSEAPSLMESTGLCQRNDYKYGGQSNTADVSAASVDMWMDNLLHGDNSSMQQGNEEQMPLYDGDISALFGDEFGHDGSSNSFWGSAIPQTVVGECFTEVPTSPTDFPAPTSSYGRHSCPDNRLSHVMDHSYEALASSEAEPMHAEPGHIASDALNYAMRSSRPTTFSEYSTQGQRLAPVQSANLSNERVSADPSHQDSEFGQYQTRHSNQNMYEQAAHVEAVIEKETTPTHAQQTNSPCVTTDHYRLPTAHEISNNIGKDGIDRWGLHLIFDSKAPYETLLEAQEEFDRRVAQVAEEDTSNSRFYLKKDLEPHQFAQQDQHGTCVAEASSNISATDPESALRNTESIPEIAMGPHDRTTQGVQKAGQQSSPSTGRKRRGRTSDAASEHPAQRQRTEHSSQPAASTASAGPATRINSHVSSMSAYREELQRQVAQKRKLKAERLAKIEVAKRRKADEERRAKEEAERLEREAIAQLEAELVELEEDEKRGNEELRLLEGDFDGGQDDDDYEQEHF